MENTLKSSFDVGLKGSFPFLATSALLWIMMLVRVLYFYFTSDAIRIAVVPDDTFYYVQLAKNYVTTGNWSFDGQALATGFHPLYAYFLVFLYTLSPTLSWSSMYLIVGLCAATCIALAAYWTLKSSYLLFGSQGFLWSIIPFFTFSVLTQSNMMMESWLVIFMLALGFYRFISTRKCTKKEQAILMTLGLLGSMSRSDFGLFPGLLFVVCLFSSKLCQNEEIKRSFSWLFGAILGIIILSGHTYYISGHLTQASAETKLYWSSLLGHDIQVPWRFLKSIVIPQGKIFDPSFRFKIIFTLITLVGIYFWRKSPPKHTLSCAIALTACLTVLGYTIIYRYNCAALQIWYTANYVTPLCIIFSAFGALLGSIPLLKKMTTLIAVAMLSVYLNTALKTLLDTLWIHQAGMMYAGLSLKEMKIKNKIGAWNSGIISYFSELPVINLDGLVNDDILPYVQQNNLLAYIQKHHIAYVADYDFMLKNVTHNTRGGYADGQLENCLISLGPIDGQAPEWPPSFEHSKLNLFKLAPNCYS